MLIGVKNPSRSRATDMLASYPEWAIVMQIGVIMTSGITDNKVREIKHVYISVTVLHSLLQNTRKNYTLEIELMKQKPEHKTFLNLRWSPKNSPKEKLIIYVCF